MRARWICLLALFVTAAVAQAAPANMSMAAMRRALLVSQIQQLAQIERWPAAIRLGETLLLDDERKAQAAGEAQQVELLQSLLLCARLYAGAGQLEHALALDSRALGMYRRDNAGLPLQELTIAVDLAVTLTTLLDQPAQALALLEPLQAYPGVDAPPAWLLRRTIRGNVALAAMAVGASDQARRILELAVAEDVETALMGQRDTWATSGQIMRIDLTTPGNKQLWSKEIVASGNQQHQISRADGTQWDALDHSLTWMTISSPMANLARLHFRQSDWAQLQRLYQGQFARYAHGLQQVPHADGYVALELEYAAFGAYFAAGGQWTLAEEAITEALRLNALRIEGMAATIAPELAGATFAARRRLLDLLVSLQLAAGTGDHGWPKVAGEFLQYKSLASRHQQQTAAALRRSQQGQLAPLQARRKLLDPNATMTAQAEYTMLSLQIQRLIGTDMVALHLAPGDQLLADVQQALHDERLLAFGLFQPLDFSKMIRLAPRYLGLLITSHGVQVVDLGPVSAINAALADWRGALASQPSDAQSRSASAAVYQMLLQPLLGDQAPAGRYAVMADGMLAQQPLEALADGRRDYLLSRGPWRYISSVRPLLEPQGPVSKPRAVLLGAPDFDAPVAAVSIPSVRPALQMLRFEPLPGTLTEVRAVAATLRKAGIDSEVFTGAQASSQRLQQVGQPRYLHLATHGFFLGEQGIGTETRLGLDGNQYQVEMHSPYFDGGLALAGANAKPVGIQSAGLLFSAQLRDLNLEGTELVVLSACDTGAGMAISGDAVDSLAQAFEVAGARSTISALWPVSDLTTVDLMTSFYKKLVSGSDKATALQQAKLAIAAKWPHPLYWAPFILSGMN